MKFKRHLTCSFFKFGAKEVYTLKFLIKVRKFKLKITFLNFIFNLYRFKWVDISFLLPLSLKEMLIKRICDQVFSRFPDYVQKSKDAAFQTLSDPKYSGKMKVTAFLSGCINMRMIYKIFIKWYDRDTN